MREIHFTKCVSVRNDAEACVSRVLRETWYVCGGWAGEPRHAPSDHNHSC